MNLVGTVTQHEVVLDDSADAVKTSSLIDDEFRAGPVETGHTHKGVCFRRRVSLILSS